MPAPAVPPQVALNDVIEFTIVQSLDGQMVLNTLHYVVTSMENAPDIKTITEGIATAWKAADKLLFQMWDLQSTSVQYRGLRGQIVHPVRSAYWLALPEEGDGGNEAGDTLPVNVTAVLTKRTAAIGRETHGSFYLAGMMAAAETASLWKTTTMTDLNSLAVQLSQSITVAGAQLDPIIFHGTNPVADDYLMDTYAQPEVRITRRRTVGRGE